MKPLRIFMSYAQEDQRYCDRLLEHLVSLQRYGLIDTWSRQCIPPGADVNIAIDANIYQADIIILLISSAFLNSEYCYNVELRSALSRHGRGEVSVVPIIIRPCLWVSTPLAALQALPNEGQPVASWMNEDEAFTDIAQSISKLCIELRNSNISSGQPEITPELRKTHIFDSKSKKENESNETKSIYQSKSYYSYFLISTLLILVGNFSYNNIINFFKTSTISLGSNYGNFSEWYQAAPSIMTITALGPRIWRVSLSLKDSKARRLDIIDPIANKIASTELLSDSCGSLPYLMKTEKYVFLIYSCESRAKIYAALEEKPIWNEQTFLRGLNGIDAEIVKFDRQNDFGDVAFMTRNGSYYIYSSLEDRVTQKPYDLKYGITGNIHQASFLCFGKYESEYQNSLSLDQGGGRFLQLFEINADVDPRRIGHFDLHRELIHNPWNRTRIIFQARKISDINYINPYVLYRGGDWTLFIYDADVSRNSPLLMKLYKKTKEHLIISGEICENYKDILRAHPVTATYKDKILIFGQHTGAIHLLILDPLSGQLDAYRISV